MQEVYSQKLLLSQEEERKRISKDLHDSLGQSLLLIKNKVSLKSDENTKELVNNAIEEMRNISRVLHPFQLEEIGISRALENLISQLDENYKDILIFGDIDDTMNVLNPNQEVNIFRIVQECISNIIKHANADSAKITLLNKENEIIISIKDNGVGFDFSEKYNDFKSLGLKTIKERVKFLKGTLKVDSIKNQGTTFTIQFLKV
ncbi:MAG: sensor histidine kinase [Polaribacter sp.]